MKDGRKFLKMPTLIRYILIFLLLNIFSNNLYTYSQHDPVNSDSSKPLSKLLSLEECIQIALENNHKIKINKKSVLISESRKEQAKSGYWPHLSAAAGYSLIDQDPIFSMPAMKMEIPPLNLFGSIATLPPIDVPAQEIKLMDNHNFQAILEMSFPIYTGGKIKALYRQAESGVDISKQDYRKTNLEVQYDITRYYYGAILAKKIYDIASNALERLDVTLKLTQSVYENGSGSVTKLDYLKNKIIVDQVRSIVTEMKKNVSLSKDALAFTMGTDNNFDLAEANIPSFTTDIESIESEPMVYKNNPDWLKVNSALNYHQAKVDEAYSDHLPKIGITGSLTQHFNSYKSGLTNKYNRQMWIISLGAEIPIFNGFRISNAVNEAKIELSKTTEEKALLEDALFLQVRDVLKRIEISDENINNTMQSKITAAENRSLNERAFQLDMAEAKDLIEAQIMESIMEIQYEKTLYDQIEARAYFNYLTGRTMYGNSEK